MHMRKFLSLLAVLLLCSAVTFAQTRTITGKVRDEKGDPIPFATITIKGSKSGTSADVNGNFSLQAEQGNTLVISSTGFQSHEVSVGAQNQLSIQLGGTARLIDEVIVTAGGIKARRKEIGTANS